MNELNFTLFDYLSIFNKIVSNGDKLDGKYLYQGITAWYDYDGYTCYLSYKDLTLTLLFHGKYSYEFCYKKTMSDFVIKISRLLSQNC